MSGILHDDYNLKRLSLEQVLIVISKEKEKDDIIKWEIMKEQDMYLDENGFPEIPEDELDEILNKVEEDINHDLELFRPIKKEIMKFTMPNPSPDYKHSFFHLITLVKIKTKYTQSIYEIKADTY